MPRLADPVAVGSRTSPSRVVFGPHETNLGRGRALSDRHVAYYRQRAAGGAGVVVLETASVHPSDWPYERAPLAGACGVGWRAVAEACAPHGTLVLAGLGHAGGQGSSAYSQAALWAPSRVADAASRELPAEMEREEIEAVVGGFAEAAALAASAGLAGVEVDAGPRSLLRQFHSGLTNHRGDGYGADRLALTSAVLAAVRRGVGPDGIVALRLSCDELAPWAGVTPEQAEQQVDALAGLIDLLVVVRGGPYSTDAYRPRAHAGEGFNRELTRRVREVVAGRAAVVLQGSVVEVATAEAALEEGVADLVEMTRAEIADADLVAKVRAGNPGQVRPCVLCNQACAVRDARNPIVSCIGEPSSGHETTDAPVAGTASARRRVLVVGGGPAGLECARVAAARGHDVRLVEATDRLGGALAGAAVGSGRDRLARLAGWLADECARLGVTVSTGVAADAGTVASAMADGVAVVLATGSRPSPERLLERGLRRPGDPGRAPVVLDALEALAGTPGDLPPGPVVVDDPVGGPIGVAVAEWLAAAGRSVAVVTQDQVVGNGLSRSGDLSGANVRLQQAGVRRELRCRVVGAADGELVLEDVWTGERRSSSCAVVVDCGHRLPADRLARAGVSLAGDAVAPRTVLEAVLEGRRRALELEGVGPGHHGPEAAGTTAPGDPPRAAAAAR